MRTVLVIVGRERTSLWDTGGSELGVLPETHATTIAVHFDQNDGLTTLDSRGILWSFPLRPLALLRLACEEFRNREGNAEVFSNCGATLRQ